MRVLVLLAAALLFPACAAMAFDDAERGQAQGIVREQVEAFSHDDAATAWSFASPSIQQMFPSPGMFLAMVAHAYPPVYRNKSFTFGEAKDDGKTLAQKARIVDADGVPWDALYTLEKQADGGWKITGCVLLKAVDQAV